MHGWIQKLLKSRQSLLPQREQEAKRSTLSSVSTSPSSTSSCCSSSSSSLGPTPSKPPQPHTALNSPLRWNREYDMLVCHSSVDGDIEEAERLVSFLEAPPRNLRCFLVHRDSCPGGAISTELCQAVQNSHLRVLLITPNFLQDDWCKYIMHQALAEGPMSNQIIPLVKNLSRSQYPQEVMFVHPIDLSSNPDPYPCIHKTVLNYLKDLVKNEKTLDCNMDGSSSQGISGEGRPHFNTTTEVKEKRDDSFNDVCCNHNQRSPN
ncbi:toll/interleukin-1 receptor domain-containing adapter protein isoform X2 [Cottoperca gobio]|uniref:Toll/interleukin-1 receptor domain-containing adapter protein isoform X2 n=1 Tax=Cottoperca gobio TaxID=56716 RepID=A0A6J2QZQ7_COTGO|nr:toll/interleukin-1 receptor domain-containing adapter protein isoform X2 [Cottoperca gobio]